MRIVLASESPFRKRALDRLGLPYEICPSRIDEKAIRDNDPACLTRKLAEAKAQRVAKEHPDAVVVSGDAVAAESCKIYEKPRSVEEAAQFLRELSGSEFQFVTALAVLHARTRKMVSTVETANISFRTLLEREIRQYVRKYAVLSYAGAFESDAVLFFADRISGSYNFVTALPVSRLIVFLRAQGYASSPSACPFALLRFWRHHSDVMQRLCPLTPPTHRSINRFAHSTERPSVAVRANQIS